MPRGFRCSSRGRQRASAREAASSRAEGRARTSRTGASRRTPGWPTVQASSAEGSRGRCRRPTRSPSAGGCPAQLPRGRSPTVGGARWPRSDLARGYRRSQAAPVRRAGACAQDGRRASSPRCRLRRRARRARARGSPSRHGCYVAGLHAFQWMGARRCARVKPRRPHPGPTRVVEEPWVQRGAPGRNRTCDTRFRNSPRLVHGRPETCMASIPEGSPCMAVQTGPSPSIGVGVKVAVSRAPFLR
jgi:hypothetical protein